MTGAVVNAYVDGPSILIVTREGGRVAERRVRPEYSFFVRKEKLTEDFARSLRGSRSVTSIREEGSWTRICWADDWARKAMLYGRKNDLGVRVPSPFQERGIETYEGDVDPIRRWFTDTDDASLAKPVRGYYDLETDSRVSIAEAKKGRARVLSWAICGDDMEVVTGVLEADTDAAEKELLAGFFREAAKYDQLLAWSGDDFDRPVLEVRTQRANLSVDLRRWLWLDHLKVYRRMNLNSAESGAEKRSMKLQSIAMATIGEGKEVVPPEVEARWPGRSLGSLSWELWEAGGAFRDLLVRYNAQDTRLLPKIEAKTGFVELFATLADVCRVLPDSKGLLPTHQMDGFMLRLGAGRDHRFTTREWREDGAEKHDPFAGAWVMAPTCKGIVRDVHVADFASLYPSIILSWNMSPETKRDVPVNGPVPEGHCRSPKTGIGFSTEIEGILPTALREMIRMRKVWSEKEASLPPGTPEAKEAKRRSMAYKVAANSFYGVVGSPFSRYYDRSVAESVTQNGVWLITETVAAATARGFEVVYGDTDSFFAMKASQTDMEVFVDWCNRELYPALLAKVGCKPEHRAIKLAYEKAFDRLIIVTKKRYAGTFLHFKGTAAKPMPVEGEAFDPARHSRPEIKGLEYKRGDISVLASRLQEKVIMDLMSGIERPEAFRSHVEAALLHVSKDYLPLDEVAVSKSLSKPIAEYHRKTALGNDQAVPPHVRVAEKLLASGRSIGEGARVSYVVFDGRDGIVPIPAEDYVGELDRYYLWENQVYPPTQAVLQAAFPNQDWVSGFERIRPKRRGGKSSEAQAMLFTGVDPIGDAVAARDRELRHRTRTREESRELELLQENLWRE